MNERAWTLKKKNTIEHNYRTKTPFSKDKLQQSINTIMSGTKGEESNANNVTTDTFIQTPVTTNTPREETDIANERRIYSECLIETLKGFNRLTLQSAINNFADGHSKQKSPKAIQKANNW